MGGFFIHEHLCKITGIPFHLYKMAITQLKDTKYRHCLQRLTDKDKIRLMSLLKKDTYKDVITYMLNNDVKLEQEIISYYEDNRE